MAFIIGYVAGAFLLGMFASSRGRSQLTWTLVALATSPLIGFLVLLAALSQKPHPDIDWD